MMAGLPRLEMKRLKANNNLLVDKEETSSRCIPRNTAHVNKTIHDLLPSLKKSGPARSIAVTSKLAGVRTPFKRRSLQVWQFITNLIVKAVILINLSNEENRVRNSWMWLETLKAVVTVFFLSALTIFLSGGKSDLGHFPCSSFRQRGPSH